MPVRFEPAEGGVRIEGALVECDDGRPRYGDRAGSRRRCPERGRTSSATRTRSRAQHEPRGERVELAREVPVADGNQSCVSTSATASRADAREPAPARRRAARRGTSQIRNCGESTFPSATKATSAAALQRTSRSRVAGRADQIQTSDADLDDAEQRPRRRRGPVACRFCEPWPERISTSSPTRWCARGRTPSRGSRSGAAARAGRATLCATPPGATTRNGRKASATTATQTPRQTSASRRPRRRHTSRRARPARAPPDRASPRPPRRAAAAEPVAPARARRARRDERSRVEVEAGQHRPSRAGAGRRRRARARRPSRPDAPSAQRDRREQHARRRRAPSAPRRRPEPWPPRSRARGATKAGAHRAGTRAGCRGTALAVARSRCRRTRRPGCRRSRRRRTRPCAARAHESEEDEREPRGAGRDAQ